MWLNHLNVVKPHCYYLPVAFFCLNDKELQIYFVLFVKINYRISSNKHSGGYFISKL